MDYCITEYPLQKFLRRGGYGHFVKTERFVEDEFDYDSRNEENTRSLEETPYFMLLYIFQTVKPDLEDEYTDAFLEQDEIRAVIKLLADYKSKLETCKTQDDYINFCKERYTEYFVGNMKREFANWTIMVDLLKGITQDIIDFFQEALSENKFIYVVGD